ncbi:MAG: O-antigen ligase family protein [Chloroflexota bacterium]|nr:O-antigen ligase family protein [Chloroflexota bacterium]MDE2919852.1 O-antigen ligase family protein [Chloroflexota bacterium]
MTTLNLTGARLSWRPGIGGAGLAVGSLLVMLPVALAGHDLLWVRLVPLAAGALLAAAAVLGLRFRQALDRRLEIALAAAALTLGITGVLVQVGLLAAAACLVLIGPLSIGAVLWRARHASEGGHRWVGLRHLRSGRAVWPAALGSAAMGVVVVGVALAAVASGPLPTLALTVLLLPGVAAATLRLVLPTLAARGVVAVLVALAIGAVPFRGLAEIQVNGIAFGATDVLLLGALVVWIFGRDARVRASVPTYTLGLLLFAGWLMVTALVAVNPTLVLKEVLKWLQIAVALVILSDLMREPSGRRIVAWTVGTAVLLQAGLGLVQTAAAAGPVGFVVGGVLRAFGTFDQPNPYGGYLGIHLPLILAAAIYARGSRRRWLVLLGIVVLMGIVASRSRGAWLGVGASSLIVALVAGRQASLRARGLLIAAAAAVLVIAVAASGGVFDRALPPDISRTLQGEHPVDDLVRDRAHDDFAITQRVAHWAAGWRMFQDRPLLGVGAGNFDDAYRGYALQPFDEPLGHAHNVALNYGAEAGLPGLLLFGGLILWALGIAASAVRRGRGGAFEWTAVGGLGALVGFVTHNLVDSLFVSGMGIVFALILALALVVPMRPRGSASNARLAEA